MKALSLQTLGRVLGPTIVTGMAIVVVLLALQGLQAPITYPIGNTPSKMPDEDDQAVAMLTLGSLSTYAETVRRPLFSPARRAAPASQPGQEQSAKLKDVELQGIIIDAGTPSAVFFSRMEGEAMSYAVGANVAGWTIKTIDARNVTLVRGEDVARIELKYKPLLSQTSQSRSQDAALSPAARRARRKTLGRVNAATLIDGMEE